MNQRDELFDLVHRLITETGLTPEVIALKCTLPADPVREFIEHQAEITDATAERLHGYAEQTLGHPIAAALTMTRDASGMSLDDVATATGLNKYSVSKWERGVRKPTAAAVAALWQAYASKLPGLSLEWLIIGQIGPLLAFLDDPTRRVLTEGE